MGETQNTGAPTNPTGRDELVERVARAIDPDAWDAIDDGRDIPGTYWHIRRDVARERARAALTTIEASRNDGEIERLREQVAALRSAIVAIDDIVRSPDTINAVLRSPEPPAADAVTGEGR